MPQLVDRFVLKVISSQIALAAKLSTLTVTHMTSKYCKTKPTPPIVNSYCNISHQYGRELITYEKPLIYNYDYDIGKVSLQSETFNEYRKHPDSLQDAALSSEIQEKCPNAIYFVFIRTLLRKTRKSGQPGSVLHIRAKLVSTSTRPHLPILLR